MRSFLDKRAAVFLLLLCLFTPFVVKSALGMELLGPKNKSLYYEKFLTVTVKITDDPVEWIEIIVDDNRSYVLTVKADKNVYCKTVPLKLGKNRLDIKAYHNGEKKIQKSITVYYTSPAESAYRYPPKVYKQTFFHTDENEKQCAACHNMEVNEVDGVAFEDVEDSNCYLCHKELGERSQDHAPAVNWLCTSCHNGQTAMRNKKDAGKSKFLAPDPIADTCLSCHKKNKKKWEQKRYHHNPAESGRCNRCHNPHSSSNEMFLRKPIWELCVGCHADKSKGMHVVNTSFVRSDHPTKGKPDPSRPGKKLSCISCHNPHASNKRFFLPDNRGNKMICTMCHEK